MFRSVQTRLENLSVGESMCTVGVVIKKDEYLLKL